MALDALILGRLSGWPGIRAIAGDRLWTGQAAQSAGDEPRIVWHDVSDESVNALEDETGTDQVRVQFDVMAPSKKVAKALLAELRGCLRYWLSPDTSPAVVAVERQQSVDDFEAPLDGGESGEYRIVQDYLFWIET